MAAQDKPGAGEERNGGMQRQADVRVGLELAWEDLRQRRRRTARAPLASPQPRGRTPKHQITSMCPWVSRQHLPIGLEASADRARLN